MPAQGVGVEDFRAKIGQTVREWREASTRTKKDAAASAGVSDTTWLALEAGKDVSDSTLSKVSRVVWGDSGAWRQIRDSGEVPPFAIPEVISLDAQLAVVTEKLEEILRRLDERGSGS